MTLNKELEHPSLDYFLSLKYPISSYPEDEGRYTALIPDLPGCITQGETLEEVVINIEEARKLWIETVYNKRKLVWTKEEKASLIESILFNYPISLILGKDVEIVVKNTSSISGKVTVTDTKSTFVAS